jgi:hypothetical protein
VVIAALLSLSSPSSATAQEFSFEHDESGKGAVVCSYAIYVGVQAVTKHCGWSRGPTDDAVDRAIKSMEQFIIANNKVPVTQEMLDRLRAREFEKHRGVSCERDPGNFGSSIEFIYMLRTQPPEEIDAGVADLLSIPREPRMNPCL